jgi:DNA repair protein RecO (recombination protein O)
MPERERLYRAEGIVLSRRDFGEADRLLTVFTREYGKLEQIAKGVRRPSSRKAGHLELFTRVQLLAARGRELDILTQVEAIETYPQLSKDLQLVGQASYILELVKLFTVQGEVNHEIYRLLVETLERLNSGVPPSKATRYFELRLLELAGYRPELFRCGHCQSEIRPEAQFFSYIDGGVLCPKCGRESLEGYAALPTEPFFDRLNSPDSKTGSSRAGSPDGGLFQLPHRTQAEFTAFSTRN